MNQAATAHTSKTSRLNTVKRLRNAALRNIKKACESNNNLDEFQAIKSKLLLKEKEQILSLSFYQNFYNLSLNNF